LTSGAVPADVQQVLGKWIDGGDIYLVAIWKSDIN